MKALAKPVEGNAGIVEDGRTAGKLRRRGAGSGGKRVGAGVDIGILAGYSKKMI